MKSILIVEDQPEKIDALKFFFESKTEGLLIDEAKSLRGAIKSVLVKEYPYDLIILDMSMPNFDPSNEDDADTSPESFAGRDFLEILHLRGFSIPVVVVTQYALFEGGETTLEQLTDEFSRKYPNFFLGSIYYNSATDAWKTQLLNMLKLK